MNTIHGGIIGLVRGVRRADCRTVGLLHLPGQLAPQLGQPHLLSHIITAVVGVLVPQVAAGVPLSLWWRKSGNLIVTDTTHAFYDTVRNIILGVVA